MISFTELVLEEAAGVRDLHGPYGVCVDRDWAISKGARPVKYVSLRSPDFQILRSVIEHMRPRPKSVSGELGGIPEQDILQMAAELTISDPRFAAAAGAPNAFLNLMWETGWWETTGHEEEKEWRMRCKEIAQVKVIHSTDGPEIASKEKQIDILKLFGNITAGGLDQYRLTIEPAACIALVAPAKRVSALRARLRSTPYEDHPIWSV